MVRPLTAVILRPMRHCARPPPSIQMRTTSGGRSPACASGWGRGTPTSGSTVVGVAWQEAPFLAGGTISAVSTAWRVARRHRSASARRRRAAHKSWHRSTCTCGTIDHRPVARPGSQGRAGHLGGSARRRGRGRRAQKGRARCCMLIALTDPRALWYTMYMAHHALAVSSYSCMILRIKRKSP